MRTTEQQRAQIDEFRYLLARLDRDEHVTIEAAPSYAPQGSILVRMPRKAWVVEPSGKKWGLDA